MTISHKGKATANVMTVDDYALTPSAVKDRRDNSTRTSRMLAISRRFSRFYLVVRR